MESDLLDFIQSSFKSVWSLEVLIFLQNHPDRPWTPDELVRELRGSGPVVDQSLTALQAAGLIVGDIDGAVRFLPASPDLIRLAKAVERAYSDKPGAVRRAILSAPNDKLQTFADAFKLKKD